MKKQIIDFDVVSVQRHDCGTALVELTPTDGAALPQMVPGQFVNILVGDSREAFLRRPISIFNADEKRNILSLFIKRAGEGTQRLCDAREGDKWNILLPLGNGFKLDYKSGDKPLLVGGGVGVAPLYYFGWRLKADGVEPAFLLGGASAADLPLLHMFEEIGETYVTTADGSEGVKGFVTDHPALASGKYTSLSVCGPTPMMKAVASVAAKLGIECEVSLENRMACGVGACLCCVQDTDEGHKCVCTDGPVFDYKTVKW